jgi:hypothetical protein
MSSGPDLNPFRIVWNRHGREQWDTMLAACKRPTLTQTSTYALAPRDVLGDKADFGLIRFNKQPIGLVVATASPSCVRPAARRSIPARSGCR